MFLRDHGAHGGILGAQTAGDQHRLGHQRRVARRPRRGAGADHPDCGAFRLALGILRGRTSRDHSRAHDHLLRRGAANPSRQSRRARRQVGRAGQHRRILFRSALPQRVAVLRRRRLQPDFAVFVERVRAALHHSGGGSGADHCGFHPRRDRARRLHLGLHSAGPLRQDRQKADAADQCLHQRAGAAASAGADALCEPVADGALVDRVYRRPIHCGIDAGHHPDRDDSAPSRSRGHRARDDVRRIRRRHRGACYRRQAGPVAWLAADAMGCRRFDGRPVRRDTVHARNGGSRGRRRSQRSPHRRRASLRAKTAATVRLPAGRHRAFG